MNNGLFLAEGFSNMFYELGLNSVNSGLVVQKVVKN